MRLDQETIHRRIADLLRERRAFVVATILDVKGSGPQKPGARMIIHRDGSFEFTIGGGTFEAEVLRDALACFTQRTPTLRQYKLTKSELGMYCQGLVDVSFESYQPVPRLLIFGGGHVGQALGKIASASELFHVVIVDDRKQYAERKRHPDVDEAIYTDRQWERNVPAVDECTYVVIVTRCHATDQLLVKRYLDQNQTYLGLIGSRAKIRQFFRELEQEGIAAKQLEHLHAPIGLPIGGKNPSEVAISILAELIQVKNNAGRKATALQIKSR